MNIRLHDMRMHTNVLGPGIRTAIWFQGCNRRCKGCMSSSSRPLDGGTLVDLDKVLSAIKNTTDIEGITISGGEPFLQIDALFALLKSLRSDTELGIIIYTGYTMAELSALNNPMVDEIIRSLADIIIDGEYIDELNDGGSLKGSSNQTVNYLTDRYVPYKALYEGTSRNAEVFVSGEEAFFVGVPDRDTLSKWKHLSDSTQ